MAETSKGAGSAGTKSTKTEPAAGQGTTAQGPQGVELPGLQKDRVAAAGRDDRPYAERSDDELRSELMARGMTVAGQDRDSAIAALEAYDRDGTQGADAPTGNHPETLRRHADEEAERQRRAHEQ